MGRGEWTTEVWLATVLAKVLATVLATVLVKVYECRPRGSKSDIRGGGREKEEEDTVTCSLRLKHHSSRTTGYWKREKKNTGNGFDFHLFLNRINLKGKFREAT